jgi:hypothetical protein
MKSGYHAALLSRNSDRRVQCWRGVFARFFLFVMALIAACQPVPRPFADDQPPPNSPILTPPDSAGIFVLPVEGEPTAAEAMAEALREADVPASATAQNRRSYRLSGTMSGEDGRAAVHWILRDAQGATIGEASAAVGAGAPNRIDGLARRAATQIAKLVQSTAPPPRPIEKPLLAFHGVLGAPGDGNRALTRAMGETLHRAQVPVAEKPTDLATFILSGSVNLDPPEGGKQQVHVVWAVTRPDGKPLGQVKQDNAVPAGSLDRNWGDVAYLVTTAAGDGITAILERAKQADH